MKRVPFLLLVLLSITSCTTRDSPTEPDLEPSFSTGEVVCEGYIRLVSQAQVDAFNCTEVTGTLNIRPYPNPSNDITNLDGLLGLTSVGGELLIDFNTALTNVDGLSGLTSVGGHLRIGLNNVLTNVDGLSGVTSVGTHLIIDGNPQLSACVCGLCALLADGGVGGSVVIVDNMAGCNSEVDILVSCRAQTFTSDIEELLADGLLNDGEANSLISKLESAVRSTGKGNTGAAINKLNSFINQVAALVNSGRLTPEEAQPLFDAAQDMIDLLTGG